MKTNTKLVNKKWVTYEICYQLNFYGENIKLNNKQQVYFNREKAIIDMVKFRDDFLTGFNFYDDKRTIQNDLHDHDGYLVAVNCFKNGNHIGMVQLSELEIIK